MFCGRETRRGENKDSPQGATGAVDLSLARTCHRGRPLESSSLAPSADQAEPGPQSSAAPRPKAAPKDCALSVNSARMTRISSLFFISRRRTISHSERARSGGGEEAWW